jgi:hypothetical protein
VGRPEEAGAGVRAREAASQGRARDSRPEGNTEARAPQRRGLVVSGKRLASPVRPGALRQGAALRKVMHAARTGAHHRRVAARRPAGIVQSQQGPKDGARSPAGTTGTGRKDAGHQKVIHAARAGAHHRRVAARRPAGIAQSQQGPKGAPMIPDALTGTGRSGAGRENRHGKKRHPQEDAVRPNAHHGPARDEAVPGMSARPYRGRQRPGRKFL